MSGLAGAAFAVCGAASRAPEQAEAAAGAAEAVWLPGRVQGASSHRAPTAAGTHRGTAGEQPFSSLLYPHRVCRKERGSHLHQEATEPHTGSVSLAPRHHHMLGICAGSQTCWLRYIARCACRCCCLSLDEAAECVEMQSALQAHPEETIPGEAPGHTLDPKPQEVTPSPGIHAFFQKPQLCASGCLGSQERGRQRTGHLNLAILLISDVVPSRVSFLLRHKAVDATSTSGPDAVVKPVLLRPL